MPISANRRDGSPNSKSEAACDGSDTLFYVCFNFSRDNGESGVFYNGGRTVEICECFMLFRRRWYERNPLIHQALETWEKFPPGLQRMLAEYIGILIQHRVVSSRTHALSNTLFEMTPKKLRAFYLSFNKQRWYDDDPVIRKTVEALARVKHEDFINIAERIILLKKRLEDDELDPARMPQKELDEMVSQQFSNMERKVGLL